VTVHERWPAIYRQGISHWKYRFCALPHTKKVAHHGYLKSAMISIASGMSVFVESLTAAG